MLKNIFKNYDAFYNMVLSVTMMSNTQTEEFEADAGAIIDFIGASYNLESGFVAECKDVILNDLGTLGLTTDQQAVYSSREYGDVFSDRDALFDIKGDVLSKLQSLGDQPHPDMNASWYDYSHYKTYQADVRFAKIKRTSASGNLIATRQTGILIALGIGCEVNLKEALNRLYQCVAWGDIPAMHYFSYVLELSGEKDQAKIFSELTELSKKYLLSGYTVLPDEAKTEYSEEACAYYAIISSIKQDIVYAYNKTNIDFSFVEAISSPSLDYFQKMSFINNYDKKDWKDVTNSPENPSKKFGF